ncbi:MAG TPA: FGGY family carbohydrate kinase, partial [Acidimicrobiia bacterium]
PETWWSSVVDACAETRALAPETYSRIEAVGFSAARETFALFDEAFRPLGPGILWSDRRAGAHVDRFGDRSAFRSATGVVLNGASCVAKLAWVAEHERDHFAAARWILAPRDLVLARLLGDDVVTDPTLASRTGCYQLDGGRADHAEFLGDRLPRVVPSASVLRVSRTSATAGQAMAALALDSSTAVVVGAGDRACEVLGVGASPTMPMVSWGTTTNVSIPVSEAGIAAAAVSQGALDGFVLEAGLSASGAAFGWLARLTGWHHDALFDGAADVAPGADGLHALPWFHGARAPWWQPDARAAFIGLTAGHGPAELARALVEAVALDVARCVELVAPGATDLALAGTGAGAGLWRSILAAACRRPTVRRALDQAASVGARLIVAAACDETLDLDAVNPVIERLQPDPALVERYEQQRIASDAVAAAVLGLEIVQGGG